MEKEIEKKQVKSKKRVADHGEVFTSEREVNAMLDLVIDETERIESRFLEPACGDGNFLVEILRRKLKIVKNKYRKSPYEYEKRAVLAITSLYGVDLLKDNVEECRKRLFNIFDKEYISVCKSEVSDECRDAVRFILMRNIICGDALSLKTNEGTPIIFSEWAFPNLAEPKIIRRDFHLDELIEGKGEQMNIFMTDWEYDEETKSFIPKSTKEIMIDHYRKVQQYE